MDLLSEIRDGRTFLKRLDRALEIIFTTTLRRRIGLQFWINLLTLSFFSINLKIACLCEVQSSSLPKECKTHDKNVVFFTSDQNVLKNSLVRQSCSDKCCLSLRRFYNINKVHCWYLFGYLLLYYLLRCFNFDFEMHEIFLSLEKLLKTFLHARTNCIYC